MDDIHTPSVAGTNGHSNGINGTEPKTLQELSAEKDRIESELSALSAVLDSVSEFGQSKTSCC
jgi:26S proteasome non-ATPase regulatory subunit 9